jgi:outer membrane protein TolC
MNRLLLICLWSVLVFPLSAQKIYTLTLPKAVELALQENRNILNAKADIAIAKKKVWETTAIGLPQVKTDMKFNDMLDIPVTLMPEKIFNPNAPDDSYVPLKFGQQYGATFDFSVSQLLFSGEYIVGLQASKTYQELSQKASLKQENDVIELVTKSYYAVLYAYENEKVLQSTKKDIQKTYDDLEKTYQAGMADETDVSQLELNLITVNNSLLSIKNQIRVAEQILKFQIGIDVNDSIVILDSIQGLFQAANLQGIMSQNFDMDKNIEYQMLQTQKAISNLNLKREKSLFLPSLSAFYSHQVTGQTNDFGDYFDGSQRYYQSNVIGAGLTWNIFNSGSKIVRVQQAKLEVDKMRNQEYILQQSLTFQVNQTRARLLNAYNTYLKEEKNIKLAKRIYDRSLIKFQNGMISSTELTQLNIQYFNAQSSYYSAMMNVLNAKAELDKILGNNFIR